MNKFLASLSLIIGLFGAIQTSYAQLSVTDEEKAVFAYFKMTEQKPNYKKWVMNGESYDRASASEKKSVLEKEKARLAWGFDAYDVSKDFITIKRDIRLTTMVTEDGKRVLKTRFIDNRHNQTPYFPIPYGNESIAFIVEGLENYKTIPLKPEEIDKVKGYFHDSAPYEASIEVRIRPKSADAKNKLFVDYKDQWLMLGDIAYLKVAFYDEFKLENVNIWDYNAPWYLDESQKALLNLFKEKPE